jgi:iron(III) transport system ATP-binding protein
VADLLLEDLSKSFGGKIAVDRVNLSIGAGEFFSILGPSGCGKTTLLRLIAGFEQPAGGRVLLRKKDITSLPPRERGVSMVFQNYALFPHMTATQNVAFGLRVKGMEKEEVDRRVSSVLEAVHLAGQAEMRVPELSGGEQQRVAVARAIVVEPAVLLLDEPLSNLDVTLRASTREEIRHLQQRTGITTVYVTHDQSEALSISDRIAVMKGGRVEQVGSPLEIYAHPASPFVASFLGSANLLKGSLTGDSLHVERYVVRIPPNVPKPQGSRVIAAVKPEHVRVVRQADQESLSAHVDAVEFQGFTTRLALGLSDRIHLNAVCVTSELPAMPVPGENIHVGIDWSKCVLFNDERPA